MTRADRLFAWLAGADSRSLEREDCSTARLAYIGRGILLFGLGCFAAVFMFAAVRKVTTMIPAIGVGLLWGIVFISLERLVLMGLMKRHDEPTALRFIVVVFRLALAGGLGFILARSAELSILAGPIARHLAETNLATVGTARARADATLAPEMSRIDQDRARLVREIAVNDSETADAYRIAELEGDGKRSPQSGDGPLYKADSARASALARQSVLVRQRDDALLADLQHRTDSLGTVRDGMLEETKHSQTLDLGEQLTGLYELQATSVAIRAISSVLTFFFISLDMLVCLVKVTTTGRDAYEALTDQMRRVVVAASDATAEVAEYFAAKEASRRKEEIDAICKAASGAFTAAAITMVTDPDKATRSKIVDAMNVTLQNDATAIRNGYGGHTRDSPHPEAEVPIRPTKDA